MPTSDEELAQLQTSVEEKRRTLAESRLEREKRERELANDVTAAQLLAEAAQLDVLIQTEQRAGSESAVKEGAAGLMSTVSADLERAQAMQQGAIDLQAAEEANREAAEKAKAEADAEAVAAAEAALAAQSETTNTASVAGGVVPGEGGAS